MTREPALDPPTRDVVPPRDASALALYIVGACAVIGVVGVIVLAAMGIPSPQVVDTVTVASITGVLALVAPKPGR